MVLIVGGRGAGKRAVACSLGFADTDMTCDVQELVRGLDADGRAGLARELASRPCVICDEVGCGVVPLDEEDRAWREAVGRLCCDLAERAAAVIRVCCGIPQAIKGTLPSDPMPADTLPADTLLANTIPADTLPMGVLPADMLSADASSGESSLDGGLSQKGLAKEDSSDESKKGSSDRSNAEPAPGEEAR